MPPCGSRCGCICRYRHLVCSFTAESNKLSRPSSSTDGKVEMGTAALVRIVLDTLRVLVQCPLILVRRCLNIECGQHSGIRGLCSELPASGRWCPPVHRCACHPHSVILLQPNSPSPFHLSQCLPGAARSKESCTMGEGRFASRWSPHSDSTDVHCTACSGRGCLPNAPELLWWLDYILEAMCR